MSSRVSIIICTRDRAASLRATLASVGGCEVPHDLPAELVVVDNGSRDETTEAVRDSALGNMAVRCVPEPSPGLSRARNAGLRAAAASEIILFTDDDVRVPARWIEGMCRPIADGRADAVAGGVSFPPAQAQALASEPLSSRRGWFASSECIDPARPTNLIGANMAFGRRVVAAIGGFDPGLGAGAAGFYEEMDFCWRLLEAGFKLEAALDTAVEHHFDLSRFDRAALLKIAMRMGRSEACVNHRHGEHEPASAAQVWRARILQLATRLAAPWDAFAGRTNPAELQRAQTRAYWEELARLARSPGASSQPPPPAAFAAPEPAAPAPLLP